VELARQNPEVGVTGLCPGWVRTPINESGRNRPGFTPGDDLDEDDFLAQMREMLDALIAEGLNPAVVANLVVEVDTPEGNALEGEVPGVTSSTAVRASHRGAGDKAAQTYECMGHYHDRWTHTPVGWRIAHRKMVVGFEFGSRSVLAPPPGLAPA